MRNSILRVAAMLAVTIPTLAGAQPKLAIGTIRGDASRVRRQILLQLCGEAYDCVAASRVTTNARPDPQKLARGGVAGYLGGAVTGEPGERRLFLAVTTPTSTARKPARTWRLRLTPDGRLRPQVLARFSAELDETLGGAAAPSPSPSAPPQRPPPPPPETAKPPPPKPPPAATPAPAKPPPPAVATPAEKPRPKPAEPARRPPDAQGQLRVAAELGLWVTNRKLSYSGADSGSGSAPLRTFDASAILSPSLRLELYPGAWMGSSPLTAGIGLRAGYSRSLGLQVKPPEGSTEGNHPGTLSAMYVGAVWRVQPFGGSRAVLAPALSYRRLQLVTDKKDDIEIAGLPDMKLSGFELRLDAEFPVSDTLTLVGGGGYTLWTSKGDLVSDDFFQDGSARGYQLEIGAGYRVYGPLSIRGLIEYQSTSYSSLERPAGSIGNASGASDTMLGGRLMLRAEY